MNQEGRGESVQAGSRINREVALTYLCQVATQGVAVVTLVVSAHFLGPSQRGSYAAVMSIGTVAGVLFGLSLGKALLFEIGRVSEGERALLVAKVVALAVRLLGPLSVIAATSIATLYILWPDLFGSVSARLLLIAAASLPAFVWQTVAPQLYALQNGNLALAKIGFWFKTATLLAAASIFVAGQFELEGFLGIVAAAMLLEFAWQVGWSIRQAGGLAPMDWALTRRVLGNGAKVHLDSVGALLTSVASILVLNYYVSAEQLGYYSLASQFVAFLMIAPLVGARYGHTLIATLGAAQAWPKQRQLMLGVLGTSAVLCIAGYLAFSLIVAVFLPRFAQSVPIALALLATVLLGGFSTMMNPHWLAWGRFGLMSALGLTHGGLSLAITIAAVHHLGMWGAVWATILSSALAFGINCWAYMRLKHSLG